MAVTQEELFGNAVMGSAVDWVGEQFFIDSWADNPRDDTLTQYEITKTIRNYGTKWEELTNCDTVEEAKEIVIRDIVTDILDESGINNAEDLEKLLRGIDEEGDIEGSLQALAPYTNFEMLETHELEEMTHEEALVENALATAEVNTEEVEDDEEEVVTAEVNTEEVEDDEEEVETDAGTQESEPVKEKITGIPDEIDMSEVVINRKQVIASFQEEENKVEVKTQGVPWGFIAKFWNEDLDLLNIVKEDKIAQTLLDRLTSLHDEEMLTTKREMIDALFLLLNGYPPAVADIIKLFESLD